MNNILITGYSGFIGGHLMNTLKTSNNINLAGRTKPLKCDNYLKTSIDSKSDFSSILKEVNVVVHMAARVHVMSDSASSQLEAYREINTRGTMNLARQAAELGVKRFVFVSSIKVNGEETELGKSFSPFDTHLPTDDYGQSKSEAEKALHAIGRATGMEIVIIRPTLVYGPGVKANFSALMAVVSKRVPLPFACIKENRRSLVSVKNLVDLIVTCIEHPNAANQTFLVSDDQDLSTSKIVSLMAQTIGKPQWQLPVPKWCFRLVGGILGREDVVNRLLGSLQVDISHTKETLSWSPPQSPEDGFLETANYFLNNREKDNNDPNN